MPSSAVNNPPPADRFRYRVRFAKQGDLRYIGHRDLLRTLERLFRRAALNLRMTEGFHPKPRLSFPSALAVGIVGERELMELELTDRLDEGELLARLQSHAPPGLSIDAVEFLPPGAGKAPVARVRYEMDIPEDRQAAVAEAIDRLLAETSHLVHRAGRKRPIDLRPLVESLSLTEGRLRFVLHMPHEAGARPREVLAALCAEDLEHAGSILVRSDVELNTETS